MVTAGGSQFKVWLRGEQSQWSCGMVGSLHGLKCKRLALSQDGSLLAAAFGTVCVLLCTNRIALKISFCVSLGDLISSFRRANDGFLVSMQQLTLWLPTAGEQVCSLPHGESVISIAFVGPRSAHVVTGTVTQVCLWNLVTLQGNFFYFALCAFHFSAFLEIRVIWSSDSSNLPSMKCR